MTLLPYFEYQTDTHITLEAIRERLMAVSYDQKGVVQGNGIVITNPSNTDTFKIFCYQDRLKIKIKLNRLNYHNSFLPEAVIKIKDGMASVTVSLNPDLAGILGVIIIATIIGVLIAQQYLYIALPLFIYLIVMLGFGSEVSGLTSFIDDVLLVE